MKVLVVGIFLILLVGTLGIVSAITVYERETYDKIDNPWTKLRYGITHGFYFFTSWGEQNDCSTFPDWDGWIDKGETVNCGTSDSVKCAIDIWYDNIIYLNCPPNCGPPSNVNWDNWLKEVHGIGVSFTGNTYQNYYVEIYSCPLTQPPVGDWSTRVYVCEEPGTWDSKQRYDSDEFCPWDTSGEDLCWCNEEDENFYVDESGGVHCRDSPRDSWCSVYIAHDNKQCVAGTTESLYWYDNRGDRNDLIESCSSDEICTLSGCAIDIGGGNGDTGNGDGGLNICPVLITQTLCNLNSNCEWKLISCKEKSTPTNGGDGDNGDGEEWKASESFTIKEIQNSPSEILAKGICNQESQCDVNSTCIIVDNFVTKGDISDDRADILREQFCQNEVSGLGFINFKSFTDDDFHSTCRQLTDKTKFFRNNYGFCIEGEVEEGFDFDKYFGWAAFFDITGDGNKDGTDGLIMVIILSSFAILMLRK